ncbi:MAG: hypothetical protein ACT4PV_02385 [Planctomycetaceae bacterium]
MQRSGKTMSPPPPPPFVPLLILQFLLLGGATAAEWEEAVERNEQGIEALLDGRPDQAIASFEAALRVRPGEETLLRNAAAAGASLADERRREGRLDEALALLDQAVERHPSRLRYRVPRGLVRLLLGRDADLLFAREEFECVLAVDGDQIDALVNLGQLSYLERRLDEAVRCWAHALDLVPHDPSVAERLARARRELAVEAEYEELRDPWFLVRFGRHIPREDAAAVLRACGEAWQELCRRFGHYPEAVTVVTLYTSGEFRSATRLHRWVSGLSDGTIRLALAPGTGASRGIRNTVFHEFTHHLLRRAAPAAPGWLHEGLAQLAEERNVGEAETRLREGGGPGPSDLSGEVLRMSDAARVRRFYDASLSFTAFLRGLGGDGGLHALLKGLPARAREEEALREAYGAGRAELVERWQAQLRAR